MYLSSIWIHWVNQFPPVSLILLPFLQLYSVHQTETGWGTDKVCNTGSAPATLQHEVDANMKKCQWKNHLHSSSPPSSLQSQVPGYVGNITYLSRAVVPRIRVAAALWEAWRFSCSPFLIFLHFLLYRYNLLLFSVSAKTGCDVDPFIDKPWHTSHLHTYGYNETTSKQSEATFHAFFSLHSILRCKVGLFHK